MAATVRCTRVQVAATGLSTRSGSVVAQHGDAIVLVLLGLPTAAIDWQIATTWSLPVWLPLLCAVLVAVSIGASLAAAESQDDGAGFPRRQRYRVHVSPRS